MLLGLRFSDTVRLSFGNYGRLEILHSGSWGSVCGDGFTNTSARFVYMYFCFCLEWAQGGMCNFNLVGLSMCSKVTS